MWNLLKRRANGGLIRKWVGGNGGRYGAELWDPPRFQQKKKARIIKIYNFN